MPTAFLRRAFFSAATTVQAAAVYLYLLGKQNSGELGFGAQSGSSSPNISVAAPVTRSPCVVYLNNAQPQVTSVGFTAGEVLTLTNGGTAVATGLYVTFSSSANAALEFTLTSGTLPTSGATTFTGRTSGYSVTAPSGSELLFGSYEPDTWTHVSLRLATSMGIKKDGSLWGTGSNNFNQLSSTSTNNVCVWTQIGTAKNWAGIAPGDEFLAALDSTGNVWCVGKNEYAQCHNGVSNNNAANVTSLYNTSLTSSVTHPQIVTVATGGSALTGLELLYQGPSSAPTWTARALLHDTTLGLLYYANEGGTLAAGTVTGKTSGVSATVTSATKSVPVWVSLFVGHRYVMVIDTHGYLFSWGNNGGDTECGRAANSPAYPYTNTAFSVTTWPQSPPAYLNDSTQADYLGNATAGATGDWGCWPVGFPFGGPYPKYVNVFPGAYNCFALTTDGRMIGWGKNADYEMGAYLGGLGSTPPHVIPCASGHSWVNADSGDYHCGLIRDDGALFMGGQNGSGQLGNGTATQPTDFVQVPNPVINTVTGYWTQVSCGATHTLALDNHGYLWGWGDNSSFQLGQVGSGTMLANNCQTSASSYTSPILIDSSRQYTTISAGQLGSLLLSAA